MWQSLLLLIVVALQWLGTHGQAPPPTASELNGVQIAKLLNAHNTIRSEVTPSSADMLKLAWNEALASVAQDHANRCTWHYNDERTMAARNLGLQYAYIGENVFISAADLDVALERAMASWLGEEVNYNRTTNQCKPNQLCSHYKQIVWSRTREVGCGVSQCQAVQGLPTWQHTSTVLVCNYAQGGLMPSDAVPYARGERCSMCPTSAPNCENGALCVSGVPAEPNPTPAQAANAPPRNAPAPTPAPTPEAPVSGLPTVTASPAQPAAPGSAIAEIITSAATLPPPTPQPRVSPPVDISRPVHTKVPAVPVVPNVVFMLEFERRFQKLEQEVNVLEGRNAELKQELDAQVESYSAFKLKTGNLLGSLTDPSKGNRYTRASAHLQTPASGVVTLQPGSIITKYDTTTNDTKLFGGFTLLPTGSLVVPETANYYVYAQLTSMQWGPASIVIARNNKAIARAASSYGFQESAYAGKFVTLAEGDKIRLQLGKGSKLYRSGPGSTYFGVFQL